MTTTFKPVINKAGTLTGYRVRYRLARGTNPVSETFTIADPSDPTQVTKMAEEAQRFCNLVDTAGGAAARGARNASSQGLGESLNTAFEKYLIHAKTSAQKDTLEKYEKQWERHIAPVFGAWPADAITREAVEGWVGRLRDTETARSAARREEDDDAEPDYLSAKTIRNLHGLLSAVFNNEVVAGRLLLNPAYKVALPASEKKRKPVFLSHSQYVQLVEAIPDEWKDLIHLIVGTGLRWSEVTALTPEDFNWDANPVTVRVDKAWKKGRQGETWYIGPPKTEFGYRTISLSASVAQVILPRIERTKPGQLLFPGPRGERLRGQWFHERIWGPSTRAASLPKRPAIHDLRHTHASWLIAQGLPLTIIQRRMGHSSIKVTSDIYGHLQPEAFEIAAIATEQAMSLALPTIEDATPLELTV